jgi:very-short-patch-repair endonuclease
MVFGARLIEEIVGFIDLTKKRFGKLVVIARSKYRSTHWLCKCDCGIEKEIDGGSLRRGQSKSCRCSITENLTGKRFDKWLVISKSNKRVSDRSVYWLCRCICGKEREVNSNSLRSGRSKSCGCSQKIASLKRWKDSKFISNQMKARGCKPNKTELKFEQFLNSLYPGEWKYVGDGQLIINGRCPDFVNVNGKKQIIELYGDYWHRGQLPEDRAKIFEPFGYQTLVIWEKELKNMDKVEEKILNF